MFSWNKQKEYFKLFLKIKLVWKKVFFGRVQSCMMGWKFIIIDSILDYSRTDRQTDRHTDGQTDKLDAWLKKKERERML